MASPFWIEEEGTAESDPESSDVFVVRSVPGGKDPRTGDPLPDAGPQRWKLSGAIVSPSSSSDIDGVGRDGVIETLTLYTPPGADLRRTDRIYYRGDLYEIEGEVGVWFSPFSQIERGRQCALRRAEG